MDRWMAHLEGATLLIELRGPDQLTKRDGLSLFRHLRAQIVRHSSLRNSSAKYMRRANLSFIVSE